MNDFDIIEIRPNNIKGAYVIEGFSSIGLVGSIAANYIVTLLDLQQIAILDSAYLPSVSIVRDGVPHSPVRIYAGQIGQDKKDKIVVVVSEFEPPQEILKSLALTLMDWVEDKRCRMVISPEGIASKASENQGNGPQTKVEKKGDEPEVTFYGVASTPRARELLQANNIPIFENGVVVGLAGVLLNEGVNRDFDVISILSEAHADYPDARAAATAVEVIDKLLLHTQLDTKPLLEEAAMIEQALKDIAKKTTDSEEMAKKRSREVMFG
ncbi:MAG: proteasome assembly chaperone family protein [Methanomassiliicoccales archaeon]|nr:MAG: proteasome assembly chaperone family protein [Methanomassiliicoccales archaeon]